MKPLFSIASAEYVEAWRRVFGIISSTTDRHICVRVDSLSNFLSQCLGAGLRQQQNSEAKVHIVRRSDLNIYRNKLSSLARLQQEDPKKGKRKSGVKLGPVAKAVVQKMSNESLFSCDLTEEQEEDRAHVKTAIFNPSLDESQIKAVENCDRSELISIIHGPPGDFVCGLVRTGTVIFMYAFFSPGTGKTTAMAAAVLSALARDPKTRVLVTAPSHAACDAAMLAILKHWPVHLLGEPHKGCLVSPVPVRLA